MGIHDSEVHRLRLLIDQTEGEIRATLRILHLAAVVCEAGHMPSTADMTRGMIARLRLLADDLEREAAAVRRD